MKALRDVLDKVHPWFAKGGPLEVAYPMYEALDTFLYTPGEVAEGSTHLRDGIDLKRMMITVVMALVPITLFGMWNVGYQANTAIAAMEDAGQRYTLDWHYTIHQAIGFTNDASNPADNFVLGLIHFLPIYIVCMLWEDIWSWFSVFFAGTKLMKAFSLQAYFSRSLFHHHSTLASRRGNRFWSHRGERGVRRTGRNFLNVALTAVLFYFAYAGQISGDKVWTAVDGYSGATALGKMAGAGPAPEGATESAWVYSMVDVADAGNAEAISASLNSTLMNSFLGVIPGSIGETSTLLCMLGAGILIATGIGSWRIMAGVVGGVIGTTLLLNAVGSDTNPMFEVPFWWHLAIGGLSFGLVYMATDPVAHR